MATLAPFGHTAPALAVLVATAFLLRENNDPKKHINNGYWIFPGRTDVNGSLDSDSGRYYDLKTSIDSFHLGRNAVQIYDFSHTETVFVYLSARARKFSAPSVSDEYCPKETYEKISLGKFAIELCPPYKLALQKMYQVKLYDYSKEARKPITVVADVRFPNIGEVVVHWIRSCLSDKTISSIMLCDDGSVHKIPAEYWRSSRAPYVFEYDAPTQIEIEGQARFGRILLPFGDLYKSLEHISNIKRDTSANEIVRPQPSPYIEYMLKASSSLGLVDGRKTDGTRLPIESVKSWLDENWPEELGQKSSSLLGAMATLMRHPQAARGGNLKLTKNETPLRIEDQSSEPKNQ